MEGYLGQGQRSRSPGQKTFFNEHFQYDSDVRRQICIHVLEISGLDDQLFFLPTCANARWVHMHRFS